MHNRPMLMQLTGHAYLGDVAWQYAESISETPSLDHQNAEILHVHYN